MCPGVLTAKADVSPRRKVKHSGRGHLRTTTENAIARASSESMGAGDE